MSKKKKGNKVVIILIIILVILIVGLGAFVYLNKVFTNGTTRYSSFYQEPENTLDGIYLGSSAAYCYYMPTVTYEQEGICIYNLGTTVQPSCISANIIKDALKTQPDMDVIVIELRNFVKIDNSDIQQYIRLVTDGMRWSKNRFDAIDTALQYYKDSGVEGNYNKWSYYFPALRVVHVGSYGLSQNDWLLKKEEKTPFKGSAPFNSRLITRLPVPDEYTREDKVDKAQTEALRNLLEFCKKLDTEVIFVSGPFNPNKGSEYKYGEMNTLCKIIEEEGFTALNFNREPLKSQLNIDYSHDFRDRGHTSAYGAMRYTLFLGKWLKTNVKSLKDDHRGEKGYEDWDLQAESLRKHLCNVFDDWESYEKEIKKDVK